MKTFILLSTLLGLTLAAPRDVKIEPTSSVPTSLDLAEPTASATSVSVTNPTMTKTSAVFTGKAFSAKPSSTAAAPTPTNQADNNGAWLHTEKDFEGFAVHINNAVDTWITFDPNNNPVWPDPEMAKLHRQISSLKIDAGIACQAWDDSYGRGETTIFRGEVADLGTVGWENRITAMACWVEKM